jgi:hypothetical protein
MTRGQFEAYLGALCNWRKPGQVASNVKEIDAQILISMSTASEVI